MENKEPTGSVSTCEDREREAERTRIQLLEEKRADELLEINDPDEWLRRRLKQ